MRANEILKEDGEIQPDRVGNLLFKVWDFFSKAMPDARPDVKQAGNRVWTRGDGTRYRDPSRIMFKDVDSREKAFELLAQTLKGARRTQVKGEFGSDPYQDALIWKGKVFHKYGDFSIAIGSASRVTNKNSVWKQKPVSEDDYTDHDDPQKLKDMYQYYVNVQGMDPEEAKRKVYDRDGE